MNRLLVLWLSLVLVASCRKPEPSSGPGASPAAQANLQLFQVKGVVVAVKPLEKQVEIRHEAVTNYMRAMTMPFDVKDTNELAGLEPGTPISFRLNVTDTEGWVDEIRKLGAPTTNQTVAGNQLQFVRAIEPLAPGDPVPEYHFTNQFGEAISTAQFKGQALALTFLFTRCQYPTFCPRMASDFSEVQQRLLALPDAPTNWQLLTISFDPDFDRPEVLKTYAQAWHYQSEHWSFATGDLAQITALGDQLGLTFWHDANSIISHNLRTAVIDASGRVQKIFTGNTWTPDELVAEMLRAAAKPRD